MHKWGESGVRALAAKPRPAPRVNGSCGLEVGGELGAILLARIGNVAAELAARELPAFAGIVPVEAQLAELGACGLLRLIGEGDPDPLANNLGEVVGSRSELAELDEDLA